MGGRNPLYQDTKRHLNNIYIKKDRELVYLSLSGGAMSGLSCFGIIIFLVFSHNNL